MAMETTEKTKYDPAIIQQFADELYANARATAVRCAVFGIVVGGIGGYFVGALGSRIGSTVLGAAITGLLGFLVGKRQAFLYRLQAQTALCQKKIEENTAAKRPLL